MTENAKRRRIQLVWAALLCIGFPIAIIYPFFDAYILKHVPDNLQVSFDFTNGLLFIASILFGFSSLIIVSKEWIDKKAWTVLLPPLLLIVLTGVSVINQALGYANPVQALVFSSASFNATVVSTAFILGYITQKPPNKKT